MGDCSIGYYFDVATSICALCPVGTHSLTRTSCSVPKEYAGSELKLSCNFSPVPSKAICNAVDASLQGLVMMFPFGNFNNPVYIKVDDEGSIYTSDSGMLIQQSSDGIKSNLIEPTYHSFSNVRVDANGDVIVTDMSTRRIRKVTSSGVVLTMAGGSMDFD